MVIQFSYVTMFSVVWPFCPCAAFVNNLFELRGDAYKLLRECRRPVPRKSRDIGQWKTILLVEGVFGIVASPS